MHMDSKLYFHQYRRPRYNNPTYLSSNVNSSLTFFNQKQTNMNNDKSFQSSSMNRYNDIQHNLSIRNNNNEESYKTINPSHTRNLSMHQPYSLPNSKDTISLPRSPQSNLSNYGSNSLTLNQNDIYNKQNQKFNIITMKPKDYDSSIRQYPSYTLQNKDQFFYKKMINQTINNIDKNRNKIKQSFQGNVKAKDNFVAAGKYTYGRSIEKTNNNYHEKINNKYNDLSMSNPEYNNKNSKQINSQVYAQNSKIKYFNPKMLNNIDQINSLS